MRHRFVVAVLPLLWAACARGLAAQAPDRRAATRAAVADRDDSDLERVRERIAHWRSLMPETSQKWRWLDDGGLWFEDPKGGPTPFVKVDGAGRVVRAATRAALGVPAGSAALNAPGRPVTKRGGGPSSRSSASTLVVEGYDVVLRRPDGTTARLTNDGSADDAYERPAHRSPDGTRALGFRVVRGEGRVVRLIESSPKDGLQPKLHEFPYDKPGDRIDRRRPVLFDVGGARAIPVDPEPFADAIALDHVVWAPDGSEVRLVYVRRGHRLRRLCAIDSSTGAVRTIVEDTSPTFIDTTQKTYVRWCADGRAFLWTSERDGRNRLYLGDARSGALRALTSGATIVRGVERVDDRAGEAWVKVYAARPGEDPYHAHLSRIGFYGRFTLLTEGDGTHEWTFSPDGRRFVAWRSRVDEPPVAELRDAIDGSLIAELARPDAAPLLAAGFRPPLRFVAKGRDGVTDIYGILILPSEFDPSRRYPVIEDIYAGPHDHHVPKAFELGPRQRMLAELGFVVARIDGMGTNWRDKAFHDVCWRNLKDGGFPDRIAWLKAAARAMPFLDLTRVGVFGGSAGGQNALAALLHHGDFYRAAAADCGCHDNRMDKRWWNEAWMGWPVGPWYAENANATHAAKLRGALLLTVGELDRNVDPASTMQVAAALLEADRDFELVVAPGRGHGAGESPQLVRRRQRFFQRSLLESPGR